MIFIFLNNSFHTSFRKKTLDRKDFFLTAIATNCHFFENIFQLKFKNLGKFDKMHTQKRFSSEDS